MTGAADHDDFRDLLGPYALGAVDEAERDQLEAHLQGCAPCRWDLARLVKAADKLPSPTRPPAELWRRIVAEVRASEDQPRQQSHG